MRVTLSISAEGRGGEGGRRGGERRGKSMAEESASPPRYGINGTSTSQVLTNATQFASGWVGVVGC